MASQSSTPPEAAPARTYSIGTLSYDRRQLAVLFFWLMWNDFGFNLMEGVGSLNGYLMKNEGATYEQMSVLFSIGLILLPWFNPFVSTWSDRHRGRLGRRRPFLLFAAPAFAICQAVYPYMPGLYHHLLHYAWIARLDPHLPMPGQIILMGGSQLLSSVFNTMLAAVFWCLYWDIVPQEVQGRFQSLAKIVAVAAGLVWSFFIYGQAEQYPKTVYVGTSLLAAGIYIVTTLKAKEGEYPPPEPHRKGGRLAQVRAYLIECYTGRYYLWIFVTSLLFQLGNLGGTYQFFYVNRTLHLNLAAIGWVRGWVSGITGVMGIAAAYFLGAAIDRLNPVRLAGPLCLMIAAGMAVSYFCVRDQWTYLCCSVGMGLVIFVWQITVLVFTPEIYPREKLGQFWSAQALFYETAIAFINPFIGAFFDRIHNDRIGYLWSATFYCLAGLGYVKIYLNWRVRRGPGPVPYAG